MNRWTWQVAFAGLWVAAFAAAFVSRAGGRGGPSAPAPAGVEVLGPNLDRIERLESKRRLTDDLIAGRLSLFQAAAAFRDFDTQAGRPLCREQSVFVGASSDEEAYCRSVISWVGAEAPRDRADDLTGRLQAELEGWLRDGPAQLPDP